MYRSTHLIHLSEKLSAVIALCSLASFHGERKAAMERVTA